MVQHRPTSEPARRARERWRRMDGDALGTPRGSGLGQHEAGNIGFSDVDSGVPGEEGGSRPAPPASRRYLIGSRGGLGCPLCARRARVASTTVGFARTSCQFLAATWVVLTLGEPLPSTA